MGISRGMTIWVLYICVWKLNFENCRYKWLSSPLQSTDRIAQGVVWTDVTHRRRWTAKGCGPLEKHLSWWRNRMWRWRCKMREESSARTLWTARDRKPIQTRLNKTSNLSEEHGSSSKDRRRTWSYFGVSGARTQMLFPRRSSLSPMFHLSFLLH